MSASGKAEELRGRGGEALGGVRGDEQQKGEARQEESEGTARPAGEKVRDAVSDLKHSITGK